MSDITEVKLLDAIHEFDKALRDTEEQLRLNESHEKKILEVFNKYDMLFAGKYGRNRRTINKEMSWEEVQRMVKLIRAEDTQPVKSGFLGIGGMSKSQYLELTDKMNLVLSNLERWKNQWEQYIKEKKATVIALLDEYEEEFQRHVSGKAVPTDLVMGFAQIPIPQGVWNSYHFPHENYECLKSGKLQVIKKNSLKNAVPLLVTYQNVNVISSVDELVCSLCGQITSQLSPHEYTIEYYDYLMGGMGLRDFAMLQDIPCYRSSAVEMKLYPKGIKMLTSVCDEKKIEEAGRDLESYMQKVGELSRGQASVLDYALAQNKIVPYRIVIFKNVLPSQMSIIQKLFFQGAKNAILPIVITQIEEQAYHNNIADNLQVSGVKMHKISFLEGSAEFEDIIKSNENNNKYSFIPGRMKNAYQGSVQKLCDELSHSVQKDNKFATWFKEDYEYGQYCSTVENESGGVKGRITIPYAINDMGEMVSIELGSANYAHGLLSGATGCGKSTLLQMLIGSVVMNYKPSDVQLWLVDYKLVEFTVYMKTKCPHITFVGCESSPEFTRAFLDRIYNEYTRRLKLFQEVDVRGIDAYRAKKGMDVMPRIMIIVDEFHVMSQHVAEDADYKRKLENILSEVRAVGISCLFADQSIVDGLKGLTDKGKKQMRMRMAMSNAKEDMKMTLDYAVEDELVHSMRPGEAIVLHKEKQGDDVIIQLEKQKSIYIADQEREAVLARATELYGEGIDLLRIDGTKREKINWELVDECEKQLRSASRRKYSSLYLGLPASFEKVFSVQLQRDFDANISVVNTSPLSQKRFVLNAVSSFLRFGKGNVYIMADQNDAMYLEAEEPLRKLSKELGRLYIAETLQQICQYTDRLVNEVDARLTKKPDEYENDLVIWIGMPALIRHFARLNEKKTRKKNKNDVLCDLIEDKFMQMFSDFEFESAVKEETVSEVYNAIGDFKILQSDGSSQGVFQMLCLSSVGAIDNISTETERYIYKSNCYKYKFSEKLGREEAVQFFGTRTFMDEWCHESGEKKDGVQQMVCYDGMKPRYFTPYLNDDEM